MRGTMFILPSGGDIIDKRELDRPPALDDLQGLVGGYLEAVPGFDTIAVAGVIVNCRALCNEEGKLKGLPANDLATALWGHALRRRGRSTIERLVGPVLVLFGDRQFMSEL